MNWAMIRNIWWKELMDVARDRKALRQALMMPLFLGIFYALINPILGSVFEERIEEQTQQHMTILTVGEAHLDEGLRDILEQNLIILQPYEGSLDSLRQQIEKGDEIKLALVVPEGFAEKIGGEESAELTLWQNTGGNLYDFDTSAIRLTQAIEQYKQTIINQRLVERGVDPALLSPLTLTTVPLTTPEQQGGQMASAFFPLLVALMVVQGGMFIAIDVTAGEKERGTLESLLLTPATDREIFIGKLVAVFTTTLFPLMLTLVAFGLTTNLMPDSLSNGARITPTMIFGSFLIALPLGLAASALLMVLAVRTKTFKDAQNAMAPAMLLILIPAMAASFAPPSGSLAYLIPIYGTAAIAADLVSSNQIPLVPFLYTVINCLALSLFGIALGLYLFNRERLLYSM